MRHAKRIGRLGIGIRDHVPRGTRYSGPVGRIAFVQGGLQNEDRPVGVACGDAAENVHDGLLGVVHGLDHHDDQVGLGFQHGDLRRDVSARFTQAAGIEKAEEAFLLIGEGVHPGRAGTGPEAAADPARLLPVMA